MKTEVCLVLCQVMMPQEKWRLPPSFPISTKIISFFPLGFQDRILGCHLWLLLPLTSFLVPRPIPHPDGSTSKQCPGTHSLSPPACASDHPPLPDHYNPCLNGLACTLAPRADVRRPFQAVTCTFLLLRTFWQSLTSCPEELESAQWFRDRPPQLTCLLSFLTSLISVFTPLNHVCAPSRSLLGCSNRVCLLYCLVSIRDLHDPLPAAWPLFIFFIPPPATATLRMNAKLTWHSTIRVSQPPLCNPIYYHLPREYFPRYRV